MSIMSVIAAAKVLVVFFSHAGDNYSVGNIEVGNTKIVADYISELTGAEQFEIVTHKYDRMAYNQLIKLAQEETKNGELPDYEGDIDLSGYDIVFIGGPVWWGTYPQVMFTFFKRHSADLDGKTVIPFTTHEGSGLASCVEDVKKAFPGANVTDGFSIYGHEVRTGKAKVEKWLRDSSFLLSKMTMTKVDGQTLTERQKGLAACACLMAQGDMDRLEPAVRMALDNGVTINELKEAFSQLYAYTGFPRSLNALGVLSKVLENKQPDWQEGKPWKRPDEWDDARRAYDLGVKNQTQLSGSPFSFDFCPQDDYYLKAHLFGDIFAGDQLSSADREIVTVAALSGLEGVAPQLAAHKQGAVNMGNSKHLVNELSVWLDAQGYTLHSKWPKGEPNPFGDFFSDRSYLADVGGGVMNVTFEPGCRNNWHIHHKQVQVLICVAGRGWYQEWGKDPVEMTPGTVIAVPAEVKHWHGAANDSWFQHLTYHKDVQDGASNEWLEPVLYKPE